MNDISRRAAKTTGNMTRQLDKGLIAGCKNIEDEMSDYWWYGTVRRGWGDGATLNSTIGYRRSAGRDCWRASRRKWAEIAAAGTRKSIRLPATPLFCKPGWHHRITYKSWRRGIVFRRSNPYHQ
ncbi:hypothetical protein V3C99_011904 [Haemonchus contortus]